MTNSITVNVSALTDRVDTLQNSVTGLQMELQQIRNTIPTTLPEFTNPVPVNINNPVPPIDLTALLAELGAIKTILQTAQSPGQSTQPTSMFTAVSLSTAVMSLNGNWNDSIPGNLPNAIDGSPDTATGWGQISGNGNTAGIVLTVSTSDRYYVEIDAEIAMGGGWDNGEAEWFIAAGTSTTLLPIEGGRLRPTATPRRLTVPVWLVGTTLSVNARDIGGGQARLRIHDIKVWRYTVAAGG